MNSQKIRPTKENYQKPELIIYGDIREITKSSNNNKGTDTSVRGNSKTG